MERPNIFNYAKRELSQDAMVCWLVACLHSKNFQYRKIGLNFIRFLFDDNTIQDNEVLIETKSPHKQYYHMDAYAVICVRNKLYPIIFENKTNTYLHSEQFEKYCLNVADWMVPKDPYYDNLSKDMCVAPNGWGHILYVYFKTGYPFGWQKRDFSQKKDAIAIRLFQRDIDFRAKEIYLDDIVNFLEQQDRDFLLNDYYSALKKQKDKRNYALRHGMESVEACYAALDDTSGANEVGCSMLFQNIFGEDCYFNYNHQHWASRDLFSIADEKKNQTYYCFRFQWCSYEKNHGAYAFQLQQWRSEKKIQGSHDQALQNKIKDAEAIKDISQSIIKEMDCTDVDFRFEKLNEYPCKSYDGQMIMKTFIVDNSTPEKVCNFVKAFSEKLRNTVKNQFGDTVTLLNYNL